jgi:hypothetical protein
MDRVAAEKIQRVIEIINLSRRCGVKKHDLRQLHCLEEALYSLKQWFQDRALKLEGKNGQDS